MHEQVNGNIPKEGVCIIEWELRLQILNCNTQSCLFFPMSDTSRVSTYGPCDLCIAQGYLTEASGAELWPELWALAQVYIHLEQRNLFTVYPQAPHVQAGALLTSGLCPPYAQSAAGFSAHPPLHPHHTHTHMTFFLWICSVYRNVNVISMMMNTDLENNFPILSWPHI